jgi:hypothetical protein
VAFFVAKNGVKNGVRFTYHGYSGLQPFHYEDPDPAKATQYARSRQMKADAHTDNVEHVNPPVVIGASAS